jgi:hypothetical protein
MEKILVEEGIRKNKDLGGGARQCNIPGRIYLEMYFEGVLFMLPRSRLGPPERSPVELTTFAR